MSASYLGGASHLRFVPKASHWNSQSSPINIEKLTLIKAGPIRHKYESRQSQASWNIPKSKKQLWSWLWSQADLAQALCFLQDLASEQHVAVGRRGRTFGKQTIEINHNYFALNCRSDWESWSIQKARHLLPIKQGRKKVDKAGLTWVR